MSKRQVRSKAQKWNRTETWRVLIELDGSGYVVVLVPQKISYDGLAVEVGGRFGDQLRGALLLSEVDAGIRSVLQVIKDPIAETRLTAQEKGPATWFRMARR